MNKHTPGPWRAEEDRFGSWWITDDADNAVVHSCGCCYHIEKDDARLIAAAPELYEACRQALHDLEYVADEDKGNPMSLDVTLSRLRDALAKAEGAEDA